MSTETGFDRDGWYWRPVLWLTVFLNFRTNFSFQLIGILVELVTVYKGLLFRAEPEFHFAQPTSTGLAHRRIDQNHNSKALTTFGIFENLVSAILPDIDHLNHQCDTKLLVKGI